MTTAIKRLALVAAMTLLGACATTSSVQQIDRLESVGEDARVILMPPDIRYYLLSAGGVAEPHAEWTEAAQSNFLTATMDYAESIGAEIEPIDKTNMSAEEIRYETLHSAVGLTIMNNYLGMNKLPSKGENFDWSLGPDISIIGDAHDADYALFVHYRDYESTGGRVAMSIMAALITGYGTVLNVEQGFASLVDLETGDIVWFNRVTAGSGELREADGAASAVSTLFKNIPTRDGTGEAP